MPGILARELRQAGLIFLREARELNQSPPVPVVSLTGRAVVSSQAVSDPKKTSNVQCFTIQFPPYLVCHLLLLTG